MVRELKKPMVPAGRREGAQSRLQGLALAAAMLVIVTLAVCAPRNDALAGDPPDGRDARGFNLSSEVQQISPEEHVALFSGNPTYHRTLMRWPEPGDQELALTLDYSGSVEHHRFDYTSSSGFVDAPGVFGEWSLNLNGHTVWTGNLAPYLFNGEVPGHPHRDASGLVVDGCWRTCGYGICDHAYGGGGSNGDVDLALSGGSLAEFGYVNNNPVSGNPAMLPNDPASAWRASLVSPATTGRTLTLKKPDGTTWRFAEMPLTLPWLNYYYNNGQGPRAFRLSAIDGPTADFHAAVSYDYEDTGPEKNAYLHPTGVHVSDQAGRTLDLWVSEDLTNSLCQISVVSSTFSIGQTLTFTERTYVDRQRQRRHSYLFYLTSLVDRLRRQTNFHYENDDRSEAFFTNCSDSVDLRALRFTGVDYPTGGGSAYSYLPLPSLRPSCPDVAFRYEDVTWSETGRSNYLAPMVRRVEIRENPSQAPVQTLDLVYGWLSSPAVGSPSEATTYRYTTRVDFDMDGSPLPKGRARPEGERTMASTPGRSVSYLFCKLPYRPRTFGAPVPTHWDAKLLQGSLALASGETHTTSMAYDAVNAGGYYTGTLLPTARTHVVTANSGGAVLGQFTVQTEYDSLARPVTFTDAAGTRRTVEYDEDTALHSPWSGTGLYMVLLPARERALAPVSGAVLAETWYDRESTCGRVMASHTRLDATRVASRTYSYDPSNPLRVVQATGPMGERLDFDYEAQSIPRSIYYADSPDRVRPCVVTFHPDAQHGLALYQSFDFEGHLLREADQAGRITFLGTDAEGRPRSVAEPGDAATGPPPGGAIPQPDLPPYDLTPFPSSVLTYADTPRAAAVLAAFYPSTTESLLSTIQLDGLGRTRSRTSSITGGYAVHTYGYDPFGRISQVAGPDGQTAAFAYDEMGRLGSSTAPSGAVTSFEYRTVTSLEVYGLTLPAGLPTGMCEVEITRHPEGQASLRVRDAVGSLVASAEYGPGADLAHPAGVRYFENDALGEMVSMGTEGDWTRFDYDLAGHRLHTTYPDGDLSTAVYDLSGRVVFVQDDGAASHRGWTYQRLDALDRPLEEGDVEGDYTTADLQAYADAGTLPLRTSWRLRYTHDSDADADPNATGCLSHLEVRGADGSIDACDYTYDARKRVIRKTLNFAGLPRALSVAYGYDRLDRLTSQTYPDGRTVHFKYDAGRGLLSEVDQVTPPVRTLLTVERNATGQPAREVNGALTVQWQYGALQLLSMQTASALERSIFAEQFDYDSDGRRSRRTGNAGGRWDFSRDSSARLTAVRFSGEPSAPAVSYTYGPSGDMQSISSDLGTAAGTLAGHRLTSVQRPPFGTEILQYDTHGDLVFRLRMVGADTLARAWLRYGPSHELLSVVTQGAGGALPDSAVYTYDAWGWRSRKRMCGVLTFAIRDERGDLLAEVDSAGQTVRDYVRADGRVQGALDAGGDYVAYLTDVAGSVRFGAGGDGTQKFSQDFLSFGEPARFEGSERPSLGFLGAETDPETGYCYLKNRYYDPSQARFLTPDPLRGAGAPPYGYAFDDPVTYSDPEGLLSEELDHGPNTDPIFTLPLTVVYGHRTELFLEVVRALHVIYGDRSDREAIRGYRWIWRHFVWRMPRENSVLSQDLRRAARDVARSILDPTPSRPRLWKTLVGPSTTYSLNRFMVVHEMLTGARAAIALDGLKERSPAEIQTLRLKAGAVILGETTIDLGTLMLINAGPTTQFGALLSAPIWLKAREEISVLADDVLTRMVPGYGDTSLLDKLFGQSPDEEAGGSP